MCCNGHRETNIMKLKDWQRTETHREKLRYSILFLIEDDT